MNILEECRGAKSIGISGHIRPDGDCVCSCLALYQYLSKCMPEAYVRVFLEKPADIFSEVKGVDLIDSSFAENTVFDVFFCLDCGADRLGGSRKYFETAGKTINIDHHISNRGCAAVNYIKPEVGSASELIYDLVDKDRLDRDMAMAIYIGMIHDTGVFQYSNTTPETLEKAGKLISFGFDFTRLIEETFYQKTYKQTRIMGQAVLDSISLLGGRCIVGFVDTELMAQYDVVPADLDGIVNQLRNVKGADCAIFMYELEPMVCKVSMRSNEKINVSRIAAEFGGGGHVRAAGCTMEGSFLECLEKLVYHIKQQL